ncbi:MAG: metalloregulator ArsR/SmtB family transcription factor [Chloroflexota bacterium]
MSSHAANTDLEFRAQFFTALGHPARLLILNLVQMKPRHGEELAAILALKPATISHHLAKLTEVGLLHARKDQYYHTYSLVKDGLDKSLEEWIRMPQPGLSVQVEEDAYRKKVLATFFKRGRLVQIPAQLKKRQIILERLVEAFEPDHDYSEHQVNQILLEFHEDVASLRRYLVSEGLMKREKGIYQRALPAA